MGHAKSEVYDWYMRDVINAILGYNEAQEDKVKLAYNVERFGSLLQVNCNGKLKKPLSYKDIAFDWDIDTRKPKSREEWQWISEEADRLFLKGHSKESWEKRGKNDVLKVHKDRIWHQ